jgi:hypothetical protein
LVLDRVYALDVNRSLATFLWGLFCACSWTWCIGMYLPAIMMNRFGWWGFIAFAVPNVIGCAGFGYIVKSRQRSEAMIARHAAAMTWFSIITVAYHMFFVVWLFTELSPAPGEMYWAPAAMAVVVLAIGGVLSFLPNRDWLWLSAIVYAISLVTFWKLGIGSIESIEWHGEWETGKLIWLTPTLFFGFLLCPYLDLTFHRVIQNSPSRHAFGVFGFTFAVMLLLTCIVWFGGGSGRALPAIALAHILAQTVFTAGAHVREIRLSPAINDRLVRWTAVLAPLFAAPLIYIARELTDQLIVGENIYLRFLVFYGLAFPAYVAVVMMAQRSSLSRRWAGFVGAVLLGLPLYEFGFIQGRTWLLPIALAIVAIAVAMALVVDRRNLHAS